MYRTISSKKEWTPSRKEHLGVNVDGVCDAYYWRVNICRPIIKVFAFPNTLVTTVYSLVDSKDQSADFHLNIIPT